MASHENLEEPLRIFHAKILQAFLTEGGLPASGIALLAEACRVDPDEALAQLSLADLVHTDGATQVVAIAYPFSKDETPHVVQTELYPEAFAMCSVDALGVLCMSRSPGTIASTDPVTGEPLKIAVAEGRATAEPPSVSVLLAAEIGCCGPISEACSYTAFYARREVAEQALTAHGEVCGRVLNLDEAIAVAQHEFGGLLDCLE